MSSRDRRNGVASEVAVKIPVVAATTANIALSGEQTIDGVAVVADDRVLVKDQTTGSENGIYVASATAWARAVDFDGNEDVKKGTLVYVHSGSTNAASWRVSTADPIVIGTTSIAFTRLYSADGASAFMTTLLDDTTAAEARTTLGVTATGDAVFTAVSQAAARSAIGQQQTADIADSAITTAKLNNLAVTDAKISDVTLAKMARTIQGGNSASLVNPSTGVATTLHTLSLGTVTTGDRVLIYANVQHQKGVTGGMTLASVIKSGTAAGAFTNSLAELYGTSVNHPASVYYQFPVTGMFYVSTGGTLSLVLRILSEGSGGSVAAGDAQITGIVLRGTTS